MSTELQPTPEAREEAIPTMYVIIAIVVLILIGVAFTVGIVLLAEYFPNQLEAVRDVFIIALALESCVFGIVLMLMLVMLIRLVNTVEFEIKPILEQTYDTMGTVRGTTTFVSKNVVRPVVKVKSYIAGFRGGAKALFGNPKDNLP
jgi:tellurite resistance protein TehA-like permease